MFRAVELAATVAVADRLAVVPPERAEDPVTDGGRLLDTLGDCCEGERVRPVGRHPEVRGDDVERLMGDEVEVLTQDLFERHVGHPRHRVDVSSKALGVVDRRRWFGPLLEVLERGPRPLVAGVVPSERRRRRDRVFQPQVATAPVRVVERVLSVGSLVGDECAMSHGWSPGAIAAPRTSPGTTNPPSA